MEERRDRLGVLDFGEVVIPDWNAELSIEQRSAFRKPLAERGMRAAFMMLDISYVRTYVRRMAYGEVGEPEGYAVSVVWPNGEAAIWEFGPHVGWPTEDGLARDWHAEWLDIYGDSL